MNTINDNLQDLLDKVSQERAELEAKNALLEKALKGMLKQFAEIPGMGDMVHDERMAVMHAHDAIKYNETADPIHRF